MFTKKRKEVYTMKKLLAIVLCVILVGVMAVSAFASAYDLGEYGQQKISVEEKATATPDGAISEDEYTVVVPAVIANDESDDAFYVYGTAPEGLEYVNFYFAADEENIYFATEQKDAEVVGYHDALYVQMGASEDTTSYIQIYLPHCDAPEILSESDRTAWGSYYNGYGAYYDGEVVVYELAVSREKLAEVLGVDDLNKLLVTVGQRVLATPESVTVVWGFESLDIANDTLYFAQDFPTYGYPNVVVLEAEEVVDTEPADESEGVLDGGSDIEVDGATDPVETEPTENEPTESAPTETQPTETEPASEGGCGASVATVCVAIIATLGTCVAFVSKK